jgi:hypothetical protein
MNVFRPLGLFTKILNTNLNKEHIEVRRTSLDKFQNQPWSNNFQKKKQKTKRIGISQLSLKHYFRGTGSSPSWPVPLHEYNQSTV